MSTFKNFLQAQGTTVGSVEITISLDDIKFVFGL